MKHLLLLLLFVLPITTYANSPSFPMLKCDDISISGSEQLECRADNGHTLVMTRKERIIGITHWTQTVVDPNGRELSWDWVAWHAQRDIVENFFRNNDSRARGEIFITVSIPRDWESGMTSSFKVNNQCLELNTDYRSVRFTDCTASELQDWTRKLVLGGFQLVSASQRTMCLTVIGGLVNVNTCNSTEPNQLWAQVAIKSPDTFTLNSYWYEKCLTEVHGRPVLMDCPLPRDDPAYTDTFSFSRLY